METQNGPQMESSKNAKKCLGPYISGLSVQKVLASLAPRHTEVVQELATLQLSSSTHSISYAALREDANFI